MTKKLWVMIPATVLILLMLLGASGKFLVVNQPLAADVIVVLGGETKVRPQLGLELLRAGNAPRMVLDVPTATNIYQWPLVELAQQYVNQQPEAASISVCPVNSLSTRGETRDVGRCLEKMGVRSVLLVTSDYHTRRALSIFRARLPGYQYGIAAATDTGAFGIQWWKNREWAKTGVSEWMKLIWWETVDRWRRT